MHVVYALQNQIVIVYSNIDQQNMTYSYILLIQVLAMIPINTCRTYVIRQNKTATCSITRHNNINDI